MPYVEAGGPGSGEGGPGRGSSRPRRPIPGGVGSPARARRRPRAAPAGRPLRSACGRKLPTVACSESQAPMPAKLLSLAVSWPYDGKREVAGLDDRLGKRQVVADPVAFPAAWIVGGQFGHRNGDVGLSGRCWRTRPASSAAVRTAGPRMVGDGAAGRLTRRRLRRRGRGRRRSAGRGSGAACLAGRSGTPAARRGGGPRSMRRRFSGWTPGGAGVGRQLRPGPVTSVTFLAVTVARPAAPGAGRSPSVGLTLLLADQAEQTSAVIGLGAVSTARDGLSRAHVSRPGSVCGLAGRRG